MDDIYLVTDTMQVSDGGFYATDWANSSSIDSVYYPRGCRDYCAEKDKRSTGVVDLSCDGPAPADPQDGSYPPSWSVVFDGGMAYQLGGDPPDGGQAIHCRVQVQVQDSSGNGCGGGTALIPAY
jgi:hypothetical protein